MDKLLSEPKKPVASKGLCYLVALGYIMFAVILILTTIFTINISKWWALGYILVLVLAILGFYCDKHYSWHKKIELAKTKDGFKCVVYGVMTGMLGDDKTTYEVLNFQQMKYKRNGVLVFGAIERKEAFSKTRLLKQFLIPDASREVKDWLQGCKFEN